ncbi:MAG: hypothetical protein AAGI34_09225 [Pseudomonadota bacterium]
MRAGEQMKIIKDKIADIDEQIKKLKERRSVLVELISEMSGDKAGQKKRAVRSNVKGAVLDLLQRVGSNGLNAAIAVDMAKSELGLRLDRGSVSSLLSRFKHDGTVFYDGRVYRLSSLKDNTGGDDAQSASVHALPRASGGIPEW